MNTMTFPEVFSPKAAPLFSKMVAFVRQELAQRAAMHDLSRMDDHMLADIGILRTEINNVVRGRHAVK